MTFDVKQNHSSYSTLEDDLQKKIFSYTSGKFGDQLNNFLSSPRIQTQNSELYFIMKSKLEQMKQKEILENESKENQDKNQLIDQLNQQKELEKKKMNAIVNLKTIREKRSLNENDRSITIENNNLSHNITNANFTSTQQKLSKNQNTIESNEKFIMKDKEKEKIDSIKEAKEKTNAIIERHAYKKNDIKEYQNIFPSFNDWLNRQSSFKQNTSPKESINRFNEWKQNRESIKEKIREVNKETQIKLENSHVNSSTKTSPKINEVKSSGISYNIYETSSKSISPDKNINTEINFRQISDSKSQNKNVTNSTNIQPSLSQGRENNKLGYITSFKSNWDKETISSSSSGDNSEEIQSIEDDNSENVEDMEHLMKKLDSHYNDFIKRKSRFDTTSRSLFQKSPSFNSTRSLRSDLSNLKIYSLSTRPI